MRIGFVELLLILLIASLTIGPSAALCTLCMLVKS